ncbi:hybrid sensor histidine kinase/response regulator [Colwellia sp. PAMC 21821]|uniref:hybrid sensor histidine kinase/response regulator n=1 Tax=Colwellia sp. PAMC 21821 TaxID=1816219 RepID=UPI0009BD9303|nr:hybrid sensor histidine kinase/response regulator [Colwellia sp. PAMC 21821]ARD44278.1 histidine kinase [Colwellia sp. PAMC 21821]
MLKTTVCSLLFFFVLCFKLHAETKANFIFSSATLNQQLSQKTIRQVFQDSTGYLWVVTQEGVARYDGYELIKFVHDPRKYNSISSDNVRAIIEDNKNRLWIATDGGGLNLFDAATQSFTAWQSNTTSQALPLSNRIMSMMLDENGDIWLGYNSGNFSRFQPDTMTFEHFNTQDLIPELNKEAFITSFVEETNFIWLATDGNGLLKLNKKNKQLVRMHTGSVSPFFSDRLSSLFIDVQQRLWVTSVDAGVAVADPQRLRFTSWQHQENQKSSVPANHVYTVFQDKQQRIWIGTEQGVAIWNGRNNFDTFNTDNGLSNNLVLSILQDPSGLMWFGTYNGLSKSSEVPFKHIDSGLANNTILGFAETKSSSGEVAIWVATYGGLTRLNSDGNVQQIINKDSVPALSDARVMTVRGDGNTLWFGTRGGGLSKLDVDTQQITNYINDPDNPHSLSFNSVISIFQDEAGNIWIGTFGGGLNYLPVGSDKFIHYRNDENNPRSINSDYVLAVYQLLNGKIVVGTTVGINLLDPVNLDFDHIEHQPDNVDSLSAPMAWAFYQDSMAQLWVGTQGGGLNKWLPKDFNALNNSFTHFDSLSGLPSSHIYSIQDDDNGNLWLSSTAGLTRFNKQSGKLRHFDSYQGLKESDFNFGAGFKDSNGNMYFGGNAGVVRFHPNDIKDNQVVPPVVLVRVKKLNEQVWFDVPYDDLKALELDYKDYFISFEFAALDYNAPGLNQYRYKLDGLDSDWIELENRRLATFTNLPSGDFTLRAQASNNQGLWNTTGISLPITVLPPPWKTVWAYSLYTLVVILILLYFIWRYRQKRLLELQQLIKLEATVEERTKDLRLANVQLEISMQETEKARQIAEQASKEKSDFLAIMSHEIRTPMNGVLGMTEVLLSSDLKPKQQHFAQLVYRSGRLLLDLLNNILDFSKLEAGKATLESVPTDLEALVEEVCDLFSESAFNKGIHVNAILSPEPLPLVYADPARLRQIIANLTSNAIKFTERGEVNVSVKRVVCYQPHETQLSDTAQYNGFEISIKDTGIGMAPDRQQKVFEMFTQADASTTRKYGGTGLGLAICRQLTTLMGGNIGVQSNLGEGSRFSLEVDLPIVGNPVIEHEPMADCPTVHLVSLNGGLGTAVANMLLKLGIKAVHVQRVNAQLASAKNGLWISLSEHEAAIKHASIPLERWICLLPSSQWQENDQRNILPLPVHFSGLRNSLYGALGIESAEQKSGTDDHRNHQTFNANILVAEDSLTNQEVAKSMLGMLGCEAWLADNGAEAVEQVNLKQPDLVLMDCQMPIMDGYKATAEIRKNWPDIPIVALTAGMGDDLRQQCLESGMNGVMTKPFSLRELEQTLLKYLAVSSLPLANDHDNTADPRIEIEPTPKANAGVSELISAEDIESDEDETVLIDMAAVDTLLRISKGTGNPVFNRVLDGFIQEANKLIQQLLAETESAEVDLHQIAEIAHALSSMSGNSGAIALYKLCKDLETSIKQNQAKDIVSIAQTIQATYLTSCAELEAFRIA